MPSRFLTPAPTAISGLPIRKKEKKSNGIWNRDKSAQVANFGRRRIPQALISRLSISNESSGPKCLGSGADISYPRAYIVVPLSLLRYSLSRTAITIKAIYPYTPHQFDHLDFLSSPFIQKVNQTPTPPINHNGSPYRYRYLLHVWTHCYSCRS